DFARAAADHPGDGSHVGILPGATKCGSRSEASPSGFQNSAGSSGAREHPLGQGGSLRLRGALPRQEQSGRQSRDRVSAVAGGVAQKEGEDLRDSIAYGARCVVAGLEMEAFSLRAEPSQAKGPHFCRANCRLVANTPKPYFTLLRKLMEDASSKYFVGQDTSPMRNPKKTHWASIWLSNTKSSEFSSSGRSVRTRRLKARYPVWYSDNFTRRKRFSKAVKNRLATYL